MGTKTKSLSLAELKTAVVVFDMGILFANCHQDFGGTRAAVKKLHEDFQPIKEAIERLTQRGD